MPIKEKSLDADHQSLEAALSHERDLTARLTRELNQERRRNDLIEADQADFIEKLKEIRRLQALAEDLLAENKQYKELVAKALGGRMAGDGADVPKLLTAYFTELTRARHEIDLLRKKHGKECRLYEENECELWERLETLKSELLRVQGVNERAYVLRSVYDPVFERLQAFEKEVELLRNQRMEAIPLLQEREAIINSTAWKLTSAPRAFLTLLRRGRHG